MHPHQRQAGAWQQQQQQTSRGTTSAGGAQTAQQVASATAPPATAAAAAAATGGSAVAATPGGGAGGGVLAAKYDIISKIGEGTYGLVYLAAARDGSRKLYAIKTFKTGRVRVGGGLGGVHSVARTNLQSCFASAAPTNVHAPTPCSRLNGPHPHPHRAQEGDGVSPTAIREIGLLRELTHPNIVRLEAVHISRAEASMSLAFDYAEHDLYEMIWHHRDRLQGGWRWGGLGWLGVAWAVW